MKRSSALKVLFLCMITVAAASFAQAQTTAVANEKVNVAAGDAAPQMAFSRKDLTGVTGATSVTAGDFNGDGKADLAVIGTDGLTILIGSGDGTFRSLPAMNFTAAQVTLIAADMNGDGKMDLAGVGRIDDGASSSDAAFVLLGNGDGTFRPAIEVRGEFGTSAVVVRDFNRDGHPDMAVLGKAGITFFAGSGDGSLQPAQLFVVVMGEGPQASGLVAGDFDGDGKLDLAVSATGNAQVSILLGNGDGTFQAPGVAGGGIGALVAGDFNGDGKLDLAAQDPDDNSRISILMGNGDGSFGEAGSFAIGGIPILLMAGDFNGDGKLDLAAAEGAGVSALSILAGNGDGTFEAHADFLANEGSLVLATGDFNHDGFLDLAAATSAAKLPVLLQTSLELPTAPLAFGDQNTGTTSAAQSVAIRNAAGAAVTIAAVKLGGENPADFAIESNTCGTSLAAGASCSVSVTFSPGTLGQRTAEVEFSDNAAASPQVAELAGNGTETAPAVTLTPSSLTFAGQLVGTTSPVQTVMLTNTGDATLTITSVMFTGTNANDFLQTNTCGTSVAAGATCTISVTYKPAAAISSSATLSVADDATDSPQQVALTGNGTDITAPVLSVTSLTLTAGSTGTFTATSSPVNGFSGTYAFSCSGAPITTTCTAGTLTVNSDGSASDTFTVTTTVRSLAPWSFKWPGGMPPGTLLLLAMGMAACGLLAMRQRQIGRRLRRTAALAALALVMTGIGLLSACGGYSTPVQTGTPAGTYTLTVTVATGSRVHSSTLSLIVN